MLRIRLSTDLLTGLLFLALGGFAIIYGWNYPVGSAVRMGPGYYPLLVSCGLALLGTILIIRSFFLPGETIGTIALRPLLLVLTGTLVFGLLVERTGFVLASIVLVFAARLADRDFRFTEVALLAAFLIALIAGLFWLGLSLPLKPFVF